MKQQRLLSKGLFHPVCCFVLVSCFVITSLGKRMLVVRLCDLSMDIPVRLHFVSVSEVNGDV